MRFQDFAAGKGRIYFAIRDVSIAGGHVDAYPYARGDRRDARSPIIHTIDCALAP